MTCFYPLKAYKSAERTNTGKRKLVFSRTNAHVDQKVEVACGKCEGCLLDRAQDWATRCTHESELFRDNCFITLTYDDDHLPYNGTLVKSHFQNFMKRLRKQIAPRKVRYFMCGEYGSAEHTSRPHYHALLFNWDFPDKVLTRENDSGDKCYTSDILAGLWEYGLHEIGTVSPRSVAYVTGYILKKQATRDSDNLYKRLDPISGEIVDVEPEYRAMSVRPGIGSAWFDVYSSDCYPDDFVVINGLKKPIPRYYDKQLEKSDPNLLEAIKDKRVARMRARADDNTYDRMQVRRKVLQARLSQQRKSI